MTQRAKTGINYGLILAAVLGIGGLIYSYATTVIEVRNTQAKLVEYKAEQLELTKELVKMQRQLDRVEFNLATFMKSYDLQYSER